MRVSGVCRLIDIVLRHRHIDRVIDRVVRHKSGKTQKTQKIRKLDFLASYVHGNSRIPCLVILEFPSGHTHKIGIPLRMPIGVSGVYSVLYECL